MKENESTSPACGRVAMLRRLCILLSLLLAIPAGVVAQSAPASCEPLENRAPQKPGSVEKVLASVPVNVSANEVVHDLPAAKAYRPLTDTECQCRAAAEATL